MVTLKILYVRLQQYMNWELPEVKVEFRKGRRTSDQIANIREIIEKEGNSRKTSASLTTLKPLTVWITTDSGKFLKRWEYQITLPASWETCMWAKKQQWEWEMEQLTGGNSDWLYFSGLQNEYRWWLQPVTAAMKLKDAYTLEGKLWPT